MRLGPAKRCTITVRSTSDKSRGALRAVLRGALEFIKEFDNAAQVKWELKIMVREKMLDN